MNGSFQYEWWTVDILLGVGQVTAEFKARSKEHVIKQIKREVEKTNSPENLAKPWYDRTWRQPIKEVYWETLTLDRVGYQRKFRGG